MHRAGVLLISHFLFNPRSTWSSTYSVSCWWTSGGWGCSQWNTWLLLFPTSSDAWVQKNSQDPWSQPAFSFTIRLHKNCFQHIDWKKKNDHVFNKTSFIYSLTISYIWTIYFGHFHSQLSHPSLSRYSQRAPPFPLHVPFFCFVAHQVLVLPGLVEWWFILPARSYAGLEKWPRFPDDSYLNMFTYVILSISLPYHFWILCHGFGLPVYPELKSKEKNRVPLYLCPFRRASWTGGARGEPSNSFCDLLKQ